MRMFVLLCSVFTLAIPAFAQRGESSWYLPTELSDTNTHVRFELDSTWHLVKGATSHISGKVELTDPSDPTSVQVSISIPVKYFDTDSSSRDKELREVMFAADHPFVKFEGAKLKNLCTPAKVLKDGSCIDILVGNLSIAKKTASVELPITISATKERDFVISGKLPIAWAEYGVEDPSIFIARVDKIATVFFDLTLSGKTINEAPQG
ncbi:MAG: YceI family protein [Bdellovibrionales bacterium]|nr:YceI family protein [Bdellovibrionales bacterium]